MKIKQIDGGRAWYVVTDDGTLSVLMSYATPVAAFVTGTGYVQTDTHHSTTTSKHIKNWSGLSKKDKDRMVPQALLDNLLTIDTKAVVELLAHRAGAVQEGK